MEAQPSSNSSSESVGGSESDIADEAGPIEKKQEPTRKYQGSALYVTKHQSSWEETYDFVSPSSSYKCHFYCKVCNKDVSVSHQEVLDIQKPAQGKLISNRQHL